VSSTTQLPFLWDNSRLKDWAAREKDPESRVCDPEFSGCLPGWNSIALFTVDFISAKVRAGGLV
jgi:hypothetical protein